MKKEDEAVEDWRKFVESHREIFEKIAEGLERRRKKPSKLDVV